MGRYHIDLFNYKSSHFYTQVKQNFQLENNWFRLGGFWQKDQNQLAIRLERDDAH
jgi:hypothetical protein